MRDAIGRGEFPRIAIVRALLGRERLPKPVYRAFADVADQFLNLVDFDAVPGKPPCAIDVGMDHGATGIRLERHRFGDPARAEIGGERREIALGRMGKAVEQAMHPFEHRARSDKAGARQKCGAQPRLRRPARMQPLGPGTFGEILDDAARHRSRDAERIDHLPPGNL